MKSEKVIIGVPTARPSVQEAFLDSLERLSENYDNLVVVFSTSDLEYKKDLEAELENYQMDYVVIGKEEVERPAYSRHRLWDANQQRRNIRDYFFSTDARYLLYLDDDVAILDENAIEKFIRIMKRDGVQVACSAYRTGSVLVVPAFGCAFIRRDALKNIKPRIVETRSGEVIPEEHFLMMDMISKRMRWESGAFVRTVHLTNLAGDGPYEVEVGDMSEIQKSFRSYGFLGLVRGMSFFIDYNLVKLNLGPVRRFLRKLIRKVLT